MWSDRRRLNRNVSRRTSGKCDFNFAAAERFHRRVAIANLKAQVDLWSAADKSRDEPRREIFRGGRGADGKPTSFTRTDRGHRVGELAHRPLDAARSSRAASPALVSRIPVEARSKSFNATALPNL